MKKIPSHVNLAAKMKLKKQLFTAVRAGDTKKAREIQKKISELK